MLANIIIKPGTILSPTPLNGGEHTPAPLSRGDFPLRPTLAKGGWGDFIGFDYIFECTGRPEIWESSVNYVRRGGTVILFGGCEKGTKVTYDTGRLHYDEITLKGVFHFAPSDVKRAYKLLCEGRLGVSRLISGSYPLKHIQKAFDKLSKGIGIKYAIIPSREGCRGG